MLESSGWANWAHYDICYACALSIQHYDFECAFLASVCPLCLLINVCVCFLHFQPALTALRGWFVFVEGVIIISDQSLTLREWCLPERSL
jgi:hypothetical protein